MTDPRPARGSTRREAGGGAAAGRARHPTTRGERNPARGHGGLAKGGPGRRERRGPEDSPSLTPR